MKSRMIFALLNAAAVLSLSMCDPAESVAGDLDSLEKRIDALEEIIASVNSNAVASKELTDTTVMIKSYESTENGYVLELTNGKTIEIIFGKESRGIVPVIGVDSLGRWVMSLDAGASFSVIDKAEDPFSKFGKTPQVKVDDAGYWVISYDAGQNYERILTDGGIPVSAVDGREVAGKYAFFANVTPDLEKGVMTFHLTSEETIVVPLFCASEVKVPGFVQKDRIFCSQTLEYDCSLVDIDKAFWQTVPKGWTASLTDSKLTFTAPEKCTAGEYTFELVTVNSNGVLSSQSFCLTLDERLFFDDFDKGDIPDSRYWELITPKYETGWRSKMSNSYENAFLKDGNLVLRAEKYGDGYRSAGIESKFYFGQCRIEVRARFSQLISSGVNHAIWLFPAPYSTPWPTGGEVDIVEHLNNNTNMWQTVHSNYTYNLNMDADAKHKKTSIQVSEFNVYGVEITAESTIFYLNGVETFRYDNAHLENESVKGQYPFFKEDYYLLLATHLGSDWPGPVAIDELPTTMEIDWVKITTL